MNTSRRFSRPLQALAERRTEIPASPASVEREPPLPTLSTVLAKTGSLPAGALFLGVASDGLPVLLDLRDPHPGSLLIMGDAGSGKTAFLKSIAGSVTLTQGPGDVQFAVITKDPKEWLDVRPTPHSRGVYALDHSDAGEMLHSLFRSAHSREKVRCCTLLLIDDLESAASLAPQNLQHLRWLMLRGPSRRIAPIVTLEAARYGQIILWLQKFRTRIFGCVSDPRVAEALGADNASALDQLQPPVQFALRERENWLRFRLASF
jgi:hypothetical protein